jgi:hypothetical protein
VVWDGTLQGVRPQGDRKRLNAIGAAAAYMIVAVNATATQAARAAHNQPPRRRVWDSVWAFMMDSLFHICLDNTNYGYSLTHWRIL